MNLSGFFLFSLTTINTFEGLCLKGSNTLHEAKENYLPTPRDSHYKDNPLGESWNALFSFGITQAKQISPLSLPFRLVRGTLQQN